MADTELLRYRVLTGPDDRAFCERVSAALDDGYRLHGAPTLTFDGARVIVGQALVLTEPGFELAPLGTDATPNQEA